MNLQVVNKDIHIGVIRVIGVASSSLLLVGDACNINLSAMADTPPEAVGPIVPLPPPR
ncbi:spore gernimation protein GerPD [Gorillibacterium sp. sgz500922]|uniref:spore gernimation protein GerPD n=1 Tax=Gorillibacterium sp. sgz500922 TaxID=3446694 RepID=UPI003F677CDF